MKATTLNKLIYSIARAAVRPFMSSKYRFKTDMVPVMDEPYIMLANHTTEDDMFFTAIASSKHMNFVAGEHLLRNKNYGWLLRTLINPIPLPKGGSPLTAVKEIFKRAGAGDNICMFPEGKRSFHGETIPSPASLGKLIKGTGCALVTYRIRGGYFTYPRWAPRHHRKGHVEGKVMGVYSSSQLSEMTPQQITDIINRDIYENAYETQRKMMWPYIGENKAKGMEHILFMCPCCGGMDTIKTEGDNFSCSCGMHGTYDDYGFLKSDELPFDDVLSWMRWIEPRFDEIVSLHADDELFYTEDSIRLYKMLDNYENEDITNGSLKVYTGKMIINDNPDHTFPFKEIQALSILFGNILLFTHKGVYYGITGDEFKAWKCARLWHLVKGDTQDRSKEI